MTRRRHIWSSDEKEYLKEIVVGKSYKEIRELMISKFKYDFTIKQIRSAIMNYGLNTGRKTAFKKGHSPSFKIPIGGERVTPEGYIIVKVENDKYIFKQRLIYEQHYGIKLKENEKIVFLDSDKTNFDINNLEKVTTNQLMYLNKNKLISSDAQLTKTGVVITKIVTKCKELKR